MRVTQGMLTNNSINTINRSYNRLSELYNQMDTGKKITKPSQDPVIAMKGINYRKDVTQVEQYQRNLDEGMTWVDSADDALDKATNVVQRMRELLLQAANDTNTTDQRQAIATEIEQLTQHLETVGNTKIGDKYIFNGTNTTQQPVDTSAVPPVYAGENGYTPVQIQIADGVYIDISTDGSKVFGQNTFDALNQIVTDLRDPNVTSDQIGDMVSSVDEISTNILSSRTEIGARTNRMEMIDERLSAQDVLSKKIMSDNEDADVEKVIVDLKTQETMHRAALAVGARIIQPSLLDFLQ